MDPICSLSQEPQAQVDDFNRPNRFDDRRPGLERYIPSQHPLRPVRAIAGNVLFDLRREIQQMRTREDRFSIPPERILKLHLLKLFFSIATDHLLLEQLQYNLLFLWFIGFDQQDPIWSASLYVENSTRLLRTSIANSFLDQVFEQARERNLLEDDHFNVDTSVIDFTKSASVKAGSAEAESTKAESAKGRERF